jgi:hypothetical protein
LAEIKTDFFVNLIAKNIEALSTILQILFAGKFSFINADMIAEFKRVLRAELKRI